MSAENYGDFLKSRGRRMLMTDSACWFNVSSGIYLNFPFHRPAQPEPNEIRRVLMRTAIAVRSCPSNELHSSGLLSITRLISS